METMTINESKLQEKHIEDLKRSGLTEETIAKYRFDSISQEEATRLLGFNAPSGGWVVYYPGSDFFKFKPDKPYNGDAKYLSPKDTPLDFFITHLAADIHNEVMHPYYFVEGEKKAIALEQTHYGAISISGVWGWKGRGHSSDRLSQLNLSGRECYIIFDSDKYNNEHVRKAESELAKVLISFGAIVKVVNLDATYGKGADDQLLKLKGDFQHYIDSAKDYSEIRATEEFKGPLTEVWNARKLIEYHGENLRWCKKFGGWLYWNSGVWSLDEHCFVEKCAKNTIQRVMSNTDDKKIINHAIKSQSRKTINNMIELARSEEGVALIPEDFDKDNFSLNCQNGIVDLRIGKLLPHDRSKYFTKRVKASYDSAAQCPTWEWFLNDIFFKNQELISFIQKAIGYSLTGSSSERCFFICYGEKGRNGKSTLLNTISDLLDQYSDPSTFGTFETKKNQGGASSEIASLKGKRFVVASESEKRRSLNEALIKKLTGKDKMKARFLFKEYFEFDTTFKIFLMTNHKPKIPADDQALWDRVKLIPFERRIEDHEVINDLDKKLQAEYPGILRWAVEGCLKWQQEGLGHVKEVDEATEAYRAEEDVLGSFLAENCIEGENFQVSSSKLHDLYAAWAKQANEEVMTQKEFVQSMIGRGFKKDQHTCGPNKGRIFFYGIGLKAESGVEGR